ncbi:MAG: nitrilase-related carbon-nitrogen hydrolase, partial [Stellaceae bacterium]
MTDRLKIAVAQLNPTVGDIGGNIAKLRLARQEAASLGADLVVASELYVAGYPPEDLVLKPGFMAACEAASRAFARETKTGPGVLFGTPWRQDGKRYNAAVLADGGTIASLRFKYDLPNYGVFDEKRVFAAGPCPGPVPFRGVRLGVMICEDMLSPDATET